MKRNHAEIVQKLNAVAARQVGQLWSHASTKLGLPLPDWYVMPGEEPPKPPTTSAGPVDMAGVGKATSKRGLSRLQG